MRVRNVIFELKLIEHNLDMTLFVFQTIIRLDTDLFPVSGE